MDQTKPDESDSDEEQPAAPKKRKKDTKSLFSSQLAIIEIHAVLPDNTKVVFWNNPKVNSIHGHVPLRHCYEKETKSM